MLLTIPTQFTYPALPAPDRVELLDCITSLARQARQEVEDDGREHPITTQTLADLFEAADTAGAGELEIDGAYRRGFDWGE